MKRSETEVLEAEESLAEMAPVSGSAARPSLKEIQERFLAELRSGEDAGAPSTAGVAFLEPPSGSAAERWRIYRSAYRVRLVEAVRNDYEAVARVIGDAPFRALGERYLASHPPSSHDIGRAGDRLSEFLEGDPLTERLPFLPDLARFEAALAAVLVAADPEPLDPECLAGLDPVALLDTPLALASGVVLLDSRWPLADLWALRERPDDEVSLDLEGRPSRLAVHRDGYAVRWRDLDGSEMALLRGAERGSTLAELLESGAFGPDEEAAPFLVSLFVRLVGSSIIRCPSPEPPPGDSAT